MLYDPKWEKTTETKSDVYSLAGLIAWLETQPPFTRYDWEDCNGDCLIGRYYAAVLGKYPLSRIYSDVFARDHTQYFAVAHTRPWTFGAALERARTALASA